MKIIILQNLYQQKQKKSSSSSAESNTTTNNNNNNINVNSSVKGDINEETLNINNPNFKKNNKNFFT